MNIYINGESITLDNSNTLTSALAVYQQQDNALNNFALALNGDFISKADYPITAVKQGDSIDIFAPIQGG
ncbi:sulfur carrier protein ThiS [Thalassotalea fonticola]|uniref:Sulfur carrier protein ThiS n=1 Tax=Thalassotalea fonticola TaxID=3065649 RepID=A0ABZ0GNI0_9GAMM|nr:sulfur carrier protein ThiS [Colwelliaceae bacterium S1-1]